jgi:DNA (cytosine-5)-methyltransferase 1
MKKMAKLKAVSLFANVGIAETYLEELGIDVILANEIDPQRVKFYKHIYPKVDVITGNIKNKKIKKEIIDKSKKMNIDLLIATPPCQGMSTVGKKDKTDHRNTLICDAVEIIKELLPKYVFLENVPQQLKTNINYKNKLISIPEYLKKELSEKYNFNNNFLINASDYGVPQTRERAIILFVRKDLKFYWNFPEKEKTKITLKEAIGKLPTLDPEIIGFSDKEIIEIFPKFHENKIKAAKISKWFYPPKHIYRQVYSMMHTPSGKSAFDNEDKFKPLKFDGSFVKGFKNTYKRQCWNKPAFTVTMYNRTIGSQNNVHPGRFIGKDKNGHEIYSDARVLTIYELMIISSLPNDWDIPNWASDHFIRQVIGEGIPPLLVKKIMNELIKEII